METITVMRTSPQYFGENATNQQIIDLEAERNHRRAQGLYLWVWVVLLAVGVGVFVPVTIKSFSSSQNLVSEGSVNLASFEKGIGICQGGNREARKVTCLVDGDTGWDNGVKWRLLNIDTPEIGNAGCGNERRKAIEATDRLKQLMNTGYQLVWTGGSGSYGRKLVRIKISDGRYAGNVLLAEELAQPWPNSGNGWCGT